MTWSYSAQRMFSRCQRQWFYSAFAANPTARDPLRRRALYYGQLNTISAWRGRLVDTVISAHVVPTLSDPLNETPMELNGALRIARRIFDAQRAYAAEHRAKSIDVTISKEGEKFALLFENEFGEPPAAAAFDQAWIEIETALANFWKSDAIWSVLRDAAVLIPQPRAFHFALEDGTKGVAYPDLVAFFDGKPPTIIDWKVHAAAGNNARRQLAVYALALSRCTTAHYDFHRTWQSAATEFELIEAQLLLDRLTRYDLDDEDVAETEAYIASCAYEMQCLSEGKNYTALDEADFMTAYSGETCAACVFQALCTEAVQ